MGRSGEIATMHSLSNSLFGSQENYWRSSGLNGPYSSLQPLSAMPGSLPNSAYSAYDQYSSHHAVTSRLVSTLFRVIYSGKSSTLLAHTLSLMNA